MDDMQTNTNLTLQIFIELQRKQFHSYCAELLKKS